MNGYFNGCPCPTCGSYPPYYGRGLGWGTAGGWTPPTPLYGGPDFANLTDEDIANIVEDNIRSDLTIPREDKKNIKIEVKDGIVDLSGTVRDRRSKPLSYADAFWSMGVLDVNSSIKIKTPEGEKED
jgi:hypothetical protein